MATAAAACGLALLISDSANALTPEDLLLVANVNSPSSIEVAGHYMKARNVPRDQIIVLDVPTGDTIPEAVYETDVAQAIRNFIEKRGWKNKIHCLVTTYDIPIRIGRKLVSADDQKELTALRGQIVADVSELKKCGDGFRHILQGGQTQPAETSPGNPAEGDVVAVRPLLEKLQRDMRAAGDRLRSADAGERAAATEEFFQFLETVEGTSGIVTDIQINNQGPEGQAMQDRLAKLRDEIAQGAAQYNLLAKDRGNAGNREAMRKLQRKYHGLVGEVEQVAADIGYLDEDQSEAAMDNELMLLWFHGYSKSKWQTNPMYPEVAAVRPGPYAGPPVMMTMRIDGSTPEMAMAMVDHSLDLENSKNGLEGTMYIDARGRHGTDGYSVFDESLRETAKFLQANTDLKVVLDDKESLFKAADCPNAALYVGWYSLRNFQESCQFVPGAVGYHVASLEMMSLHDPKERGWGVNLLNHGLCGTLGAVGEPYLESFPPPKLFFSLLLTGKFTQGEIYAVTTPCLSWRQMYVGDPLYNPFKNHPHLALEKLSGDPLLRQALSELTAPSPAATTQP